jgi:hypothetical protein
MEAEESDGLPQGQGPIVLRDGLYLLDPSRGTRTEAPVDPELRELVDTVLGAEASRGGADRSYTRA